MFITYYKVIVTYSTICRKNYGQHILTDLFEICIIELPKAKKYAENTDLDIWANFIKKPEVIDMSDTETNENIRNAKKGFRGN